jgi:hypothetical protein
MLLSMNTTIRTLGDFRRTFQHFKDDTRILVDMPLIEQYQLEKDGDYVMSEDGTDATYETRCDGVPTIYLMPSIEEKDA